MAYITANIKVMRFSHDIGCRLYFPTDLPPDYPGNEVKGVIWLLHGMGNSPADWMQLSAACRYAADNGYVLVAPDAANSFYCDMAYGAPYYTILTQDLPAQLNSIFRLPKERERNFIAGLSMGGYGALRIGMANPGRFAAIGCFSGPVDMRSMLDRLDEAPHLRPAFEAIYGKELALTEETDLFRAAERLAALPRDEQPRMLLTCGRQDVLPGDIITHNRAFMQHVEGMPLSVEYQEWDGVHEWNFWDRSLARFIGFIQGSDYSARKEADWAEPVSTK